MSTFKCPQCQAVLPDFQETAGFCPYCDAQWESSVSSRGARENSSTLDAHNSDWIDDSEDAPQAQDRHLPASHTLQIDPHEDQPDTPRGHTVELPTADDSDSPSAREENRTWQTDQDDTGIASGEVPPGHGTPEDPPQSVFVDSDVPQPPAGHTVGLPPDEEHPHQATRELPQSSEEPPEGHTFALGEGENRQNTLALGGGSAPADEERPDVTFGSKPLSPSDVKKYWGHAGDGSPMETMRSATVSRAKELGVDLRRRVLSDQEEGSDYAIINQIGKGGMGVVYAAKQKSLRRRVAVKTLKRDIGQKEGDRVKFLSEAVITGILDHPNIVPIHELGQTEDGTLFYSMKCVTGTEWHKVIRTKSEAENLEILMKVADAVAFAHSRNVIHRDLKPENVMLGEFGEVLVMDWGLAVDLNRKEVFTMGGTPAYMAPEMAKGPLDRIGKCSDIYLLGAILYEIVTGFPPHAASTITECLVAAAQNVIVRSDSNSRLKSIALKAMATSPKLRYRSVALFQEEIRKYQSTAQSIELAHTAQRELEAAQESGNYELYSRAMFGFEDALKLWSENDLAQKGVHEARLLYAKCALNKADYDLGLQLVSPSDPDEEPIYRQLLAAKQASERTARTARNARMAAVGLLVVMLLGAGVGMLIIDRQRARAANAEHLALIEANRARAAEDEAKKANANLKETNSKLEKEQRNLATANEKIKKQLEEISDKSVMLEAQGEALRERSTELAKKTVQLEQSLENEVFERNRATFAGMFSAVGLAQSKIQLNDISGALELLRRIPAEHRGWEWKHLAYLCHPDIPSVTFNQAATAVDIAPGGELTAVGVDGDGVYLFNTAQAPNQEDPVHLKLEGGRVTAVRFSPDASQLWIGTDHPQQTLLVWDLAGPPRVVTLPHLDRTPSTRQVNAIAFASTDPATVYVALGEWVFQLDTKSLVPKAPLFMTWMYDISVPAAGDYFVHSHLHLGQFKISLWDNGPDRSVRKQIQLQEAATCCEVLPDGRVVMAMEDGTLKLWDPQQNHEEVLSTLRSQVTQLKFQPQRRLLAASLLEGSVMLFQMEETSGKFYHYKTLRGHRAAVLDCAFHPSEPLLASVSEDQTVRFWNYRDYLDRQTLEHEDDVLWAAFSTDATKLVTGDEMGEAAVWASDPRNTEPQQRFQLGNWSQQNLTSPAKAIPLASGKHIVTADPDTGIDIWEVATGRIVWHRDTYGRSRRVAPFPEGEKFVFVDASVDSSGAAQSVLQFANAQGDIYLSMTTKADPQNILDLTVSPTGRRFALLTPVRFEVYEMPAQADASPQMIRSFNVSGAGQIDFADDDTVLVGSMSGSEKGKLIVFSVSQGKVINDFPAGGPGQPFEVFELSPDRSQVVVIYEDRQAGNVQADVRIYSLNGSQLIAQKKIEGVVLSPTFSRDNQTVYFRHQLEGEVGVGMWKLATDQVQTRHPDRPLLVEGSEVRSVSWIETFPAEGDLIQVNFSNRDVELWNVATGEKVIRLAATRPVIFCDFVQNDQRLVTVHQDGMVRLWDVESGQLQDQWDVGHQRLATATLRADRLAVGGSAGEIWILDLAQQSVVQTIPLGTSRVDALAWVTDQKLVAATNSPEQDPQGANYTLATLRLYDGESGQPLSEPFAEHKGHFMALAISADAKRMTATSTDHTLRLWVGMEADQWPTATPEQLAGHSSQLTAAQFSGDGRRLFTGGSDGTLTVWYVDQIQLPPQEDGTPQSKLLIQEFVPLEGHRKAIASIGLSPDDQMLLTASRDRQAVIWMTTDLPEQQGPLPGGTVAGGRYWRRSDSR